MYHLSDLFPDVNYSPDTFRAVFYYNKVMITENFRADVRIRLDFLHIEQTRFPTIHELYKNAISLLFRANNALETVNVLEAYHFLTNHYEKVRKAMSDKKWVALETAHFAIGRIPLKRKINKNLIYVTNYLSKDSVILYVDGNEFKQELYNKPKEKNKPTLDCVFCNGEYYLFKKNTNKYIENAVAKYVTGRNGKLFFVRIELLNNKHINYKEVMKNYLKNSEMTEILEMTLANMILLSSIKHF